jgi:hypothetical protein
MKTIRLLTIGNSFSENALTYLERIGEGTDTVRFEVGRASLGGCSLEKHWNLAAYTERQPDSKSYQLCKGDDCNPVRANLRDALSAKPWDFVSLQQVSSCSWRRETFDPWLGQLHALISELAPQAKICLHQTWAYRTDTPYYPENGITQEIMHRHILDNFEHFAAMYDCSILPSGEAVNRVRNNPEQSFAWPESGYDYQHAEAPNLPRQAHSLAAGWHWRIENTHDGVPALGLDANHLNARGCYLIGAVWFESLTGLSIHDSHFVPKEFEPEDAMFLRNAAHATVTAAS